MLNNLETAKERWGGSNDLIDKWLLERKDLIVMFCDLTEQTLSNPEVKVDKFQSFCQLLVDYVSVGHFEVYEQLLREAAEENDSIEAAQKLIRKIDRTTEVALAFNDLFDDIHKIDDGINVLESKLDTLGSTLEERFECEDVLIETLHSSHANSAA